MALFAHDCNEQRPIANVPHTSGRCDFHLELPLVNEHFLCILFRFSLSLQTEHYLTKCLRLCARALTQRSHNILDLHCPLHAQRADMCRIIKTDVRKSVCLMCAQTSAAMLASCGCAGLAEHDCVFHSAASVVTNLRRRRWCIVPR